MTKSAKLALILMVWSPLAPAEDLTVLAADSKGVRPGQQLEKHLKQQFYRRLEDRRAAFEQIKSQAAAHVWQRERREFMVRQLGGFPKRTPLNAKTLGHLSGEGFRVEKVMFESRPGHHVTALLYLPDGATQRVPGVLIPCGHSHNGKASGWYQRAGILMARNGMAALCYDPIGQGERYQSLAARDHTHFPSAPRYPVPHPKVRFLPTVEHTMIGIGSILLGSNVAQYRIWDGMRAIDYLQSRDEIDATRIGCTGNSGGGTLTSYLMALDDRIGAAAPGCFLTTFRRLIDTRGAQDGEQNIFGQIAFGLDEPDYVMMRAPVPTLILAATRDATFDIAGTWDLFRQAKRFYTRLNYPERVDLVEADAPHGYYIQHRTAATRWMRRWLLGEDDVIPEVNRLPDPLTDQVLREQFREGMWPDEKLLVSPEGQVMLMKGEKSVFDMNADIASQLATERQRRWSKASADEWREAVRSVLGARESSELPAPQVENRGTVQRDGYRIEKLVLLGSDEAISLPGLLFVPERRNGKPVLYLHGESMKSDAGEKGPIERLVREGHVVLAAELSGIGETETGQQKRDYGRGRFGRDSQEIYLAYLLGKSFVAMRTEDVLRWSSYLAGRVTQDEGSFQLVGIGEAAIPALHAAALEPSRFKSVLLKGMIRSWTELVGAKENRNQLVNVVHGALKTYDLPNLIQLAVADKVEVDQSVDSSGQPLGR